MHYVSDIQILAAAGAIVVHFLVTIVVAWIQIKKAWKTGDGVERNHLEITALDGRSAYIASEVALVRGSLDRIQSVIDGKAVAGTRSGDIPGAPPMRSPTPRVDEDPIAPKVWPLGG